MERGWQGNCLLSRRLFMEGRKLIIVSMSERAALAVRKAAGKMEI